MSIKEILNKWNSSFRKPRSGYPESRVFSQLLDSGFCFQQPRNDGRGLVQGILKRAQAGLTLIELVVFIVIVGVALAGVLTVLNVTVKSSADPMLRKNMLSIAESLLEEVQLKPFTWCDPDDANAATATSAIVGAGGCATTVEASGWEAGETRAGLVTPFDNVNDYNGLALASPIPSLTGTFAAPAGYSASIAVTNDAALGPGGLQPAGSEVLRIAVTVTHGDHSITLEGYRTRYSPNTLP